jgi:multisubunit Na+/H+ antiporter MnhE subunit
MDRAARAIGGWLLRWVALAALWLALTDTHVEPELVTGAVAAAIGATLAGLVTRVGSPRTLAKSLAVARLGPRRLARPLWRLVADTGVTTVALARAIVRRRPPAGSFVAVPYHAGEARRSAAGRAVTETWGSLAANRYVVGIDDERGVILVHELVRNDASIDPLAPP